MKFSGEIVCESLMGKVGLHFVGKVGEYSLGASRTLGHYYEHCWTEKDVLYIMRVSRNAVTLEFPHKGVFSLKCGRPIRLHTV